MYVNLFDKMVTLDKKRRIIPEGTNIECDRCAKIDNGRCMKRGSIKKGRLFSIENVKLECEIYGGKYGEGCTHRAGG